MSKITKKSKDKQYDVFKTLSFLELIDTIKD